MHRDEASELFACLGDMDRVKIMKMLYNNELMTYDQLNQRMGLEMEELKSQVLILEKLNFLSIQQDVIKCNKNLVDTLMTFITTKCSCC